jgi:hypothetical protein
VTKSEKKIAAAFHEVHANPPAVVAQTRRKKGAAAADRQRTAIALSKARAAGASMPRMVRRSARGSPAPAGQGLTQGYGRPTRAGRPASDVQQGYRLLARARKILGA